MSEQKIAYGLTLNLGNYQSARIDAEVSCPAGEDKAKEAFNYLRAWVEARAEDVKRQHVEGKAKADAHAATFPAESPRTSEAKQIERPAIALAEDPKVSVGFGTPSEVKKDAEQKAFVERERAEEDIFAKLTAAGLEKTLATSLAVIGADTVDPGLSKQVRAVAVAKLGNDGMAKARAAVGIKANACPTGEQLRRVVLEHMAVAVPAAPAAKVADLW